MADKTIPGLPQIETITEHAVLPIDTGIETWKIKAKDLALFVADYILPAGLMVPYTGGAAPSGWLLCDGSAVSRTTYARLFAAIGGTFGSGDNSTTFNLPDMRGRVPAGRDNMGGSAAIRLTSGGSGVDGSTVGASGGIQTITPTGTISGTQSIAHTHNLGSHTHAVSMPHTHQWGYHPSSPEALWVRNTSNPSLTTFATSGSLNYANSVGAAFGGGFSALGEIVSSAHSFYTAGPIDGSGNAASATSGSPSTNTSGAMSANATVNFSNATFTGNAQTNVQPTLVTNYIIRV